MLSVWWQLDLQLHCNQSKPRHLPSLLVGDRYITRLGDACSSHPTSATAWRKKRCADSSQRWLLSAVSFQLLLVSIVIVFGSPGHTSQSQSQKLSSSQSQVVLLWPGGRIHSVMHRRFESVAVVILEPGPTLVGNASLVHVRALDRARAPRPTAVWRAVRINVQKSGLP